jgi:hypothetical protein
METIITMSSAITMLVAAFMLLDIAYHKIKNKNFNKENLIKCTSIFAVGYLFYNLPNQFGFVVLLFLLLMLFLTKMIFLTNKLSKQTN